MRLNNFSQQNIHDWAVAAGTAGPWNSSISLAQRGKLDPKAGFWEAFGQLNRHLAEGQYQYVTDRRLKDKLIEAQPLLTHDDRPATATDLFSMFIGEQPTAELYSQPVALTDADAAKLTEQYQTRFRKLAVDLMIPPKEAWERVEPHCKKLGMSAKQIQLMREVLIGIAEYTAADLNDLTCGAGQDPLPGKALHMAA